MLNKAQLIGNLGRDPEARYLQSGQCMVTLSVATSHAWKDKEGKKQEKTEWHRVVVWGKQAEHCSEYLAKGRRVYVDGRIETRKYTDKAGVERYSTEIVANTVIFLDKAGDRPQAAGHGAGQLAVPSPDDDIPF